MENYNLAIQNLQEWNPDEQFYRAWRLARQQNPGAPVSEAANADPEWLSFVTHPESISTLKTEEMFFSLGRNLSIVKHPRYFPEFTHSHIFFEIEYVLSGSCTQMIESKQISLQTGDIFMIAPGTSHSIRVFSDDCIVLNILIRRSTFMDIFLNTIRNKSQIALFFMGGLYGKNPISYILFRTWDDELLRNYILEMYMEQLCLDEYSDRIMCSLLTIFFNQLTRRHAKSAVFADTKRPKEPWQDDMLSYIMQHFSTVSIHTLSETFHFSEPYCSKVIKEITGMTFSELLSSVRMQQGENLLVQTQMSVENISEYIGYLNPESFIRAFKRVYGVSPSQFRKDPDRAVYEMSV